jgi:hypothetical protein
MTRGHWKRAEVRYAKIGNQRWRGDDSGLLVICAVTADSGQHVQAHSGLRGSKSKT